MESNFQKRTSSVFHPKRFCSCLCSFRRQYIFQYKVDNYYSSVNDGGVIWNDEELGITWPELELELSQKDNNLPELNQLNLNTLW